MSDNAGPAPVSAVPRLMRLVCAVLGAVVVIGMLFAAAGLQQTTNTVVHYRASDQVALVGLGLVLAAGILFLGRSRVDADADGIRFRNIALNHALPWTAVRAVAFERRSPWATLILENHDEVALLAIQILDGERAVAAVGGLRALHAAARAKDPKPPPLLY
jgi:hypothetical protein